MSTTFAAARRVVALGLLALSVSGGLLGCIATLAPNVRARDHHASLEPRSTWDDCSACHELESVMARRLEHMSPRARAGAEAQAMRGGGAPLVRDWMAEEPRGCLDCHRLRGGAP